MLGSSKPVPFDPYRNRRSRRRVPRWLILLLSGTAIGAGGVVLVQERYLPPRLSAAETTTLRSAYEDADSARLRLKGELADTTKRLQTALADQKTQADQFTASQATVERLRLDLAAVVDSLPPDPRGGTVEVRAARFIAKGGKLAYDLVLTRERATATPLATAVLLIVEGDSARGGDNNVKSPTIAVTIGSHEIVRGSLPLPEGFRPRQTTIQVQDRSGRPLGMRVLPVR
jgi:hypothetical protein